MRETLIGKLVLVLSRATPEELAAVYQFATEEGLSGAMPDAGCSMLVDRAGTGDLLQHSLRREAGCWVLLLQGNSACPKHEIGLSYVARLLTHPSEPLASASLFAEFSTGHRQTGLNAELPDPETGLLKPITDGVGTAQSPLEDEEAEARQRHYSELSNYRSIIDDPTIPESERREAQDGYDELLAFLEEHYRRRSSSPGQAVTKLVHRSIQRLCRNLRRTPPGAKGPNPAAVAFADYIEAHILVPSRRYTSAKAGGNVRLARGELAGRLVFEPPGHHWQVEL
jgi:hypothetical protein